MFTELQICTIAKHARCCYGCQVAAMAQLKCIGDPSWEEKFFDLRMFKSYLRFIDRYHADDPCTKVEDVEAVINELGRLSGVCYTPQNVVVPS